MENNPEKQKILINIRAISAIDIKDNRIYLSNVEISTTNYDLGFFDGENIKLADFVTMINNNL